MHKKARLPRTSRVNEKILEYYMKFGQERDLEKFMRLYSPSGCRSRSRSRSTTTTTTATTSSNASDDDGRMMRRLFLHETEVSTEVTKASSSSAATDGSILQSVEHRIPIRLEYGTDEVEKSNIESEVVSSEDIHTTPRRTQHAESKHTQTPESIAKSHKRLEWDSLGDVGYKKSMSTSNISILERSVLKEFFEESSRMATNVSEGDLKQLQMELQHEHVYRKPAGSADCSHNKYNTPPLASSTMMCTVMTKQAAAGGARPKQTSQSTSMSLQKKFEKSAQTSMQRPLPMTSRQIQVTLSSASTTSSALGGSATPSSFDYFSSRSSRSRSTATSTDGALGGTKLPEKQPRTVKYAQQQQQQPHPFVVGITDMLASRKALAEHNDRVRASQSNGDATDLQQLHDTLKHALTENKENSTASSLLRSPQLDLGIQLLCSLIDARSLDQKQKKKLVRDIVKRISRMNADDQSEPCRLSGGAVRSGNALTPSGSSVTSKEPDITSASNKAKTTLTSASSVNMARTRHSVGVNALDMQALERDLPSTVNSVQTGNMTNNTVNEERLENIEVFEKPSPPTTSAKAMEKLAALKAAEKKEKRKSRPTAVGSPPRYKNVSKLVSRDSENATGSINKPVLKEGSKCPKQPSARCAGVVCSINSESASSSSKEVITQKTAHAASHSDTDADMAAQSTMREWLNPMTQSEIEYEEKKREFAKHAVKCECLLKRMNGEKTNSERTTQLQWIEKEIERLESLRNLLAEVETPSSSTEGDVKYQTDEQESNIQKIYDKVCSDKSSSALSDIAEQPLQEIEVLIEESNEDLVDLAEKLKRSKQRRRETQTVYEKSNEPAAANGILLQGKPRFRTVTETIVTNEEQVSPVPSVEKQTSQDALIPPPPPPPPAPSAPLPQPRVLPPQRSRMKTPPDSNDSESVGSFVQQRKREFMEQYRDRKRNHYEALLQQQQQLLIQQQQQIIQQLQQRQPPPPTLNGHYSVPNTMPRSYLPMQPQPTQYHHPYFPHCNQPQPPAPASAPAMTTMPCRPVPEKHSQRIQTSTRYKKKQLTVQATYSSSVGLASEQQAEQGTSSSSMFCMSSEVSVPMGTNDSTSSTPTTTHHYDDVAGCVALTKCVQTGSSLRGVRPILGRRLGCSCCAPSQQQCYNRAPMSVGQPVRVQVKPKAVAYIIQFDKSTTGDDNSSNLEPITDGGNEGNVNVDNANNADSENADVGPSEPELDPHPESEPLLTLQEHLARARPEFLANTKERKAILNEIQAMRQERERELRDIIDNASISSLDKRLQNLPPPPTKRLRIFPTKVMKAMTHKHIERLPEVVQKQEREREERRRRGNRLLRDVFNRRLQKRVRNGKLTINHSRQVI